ncbi:hypothetical protein H2201_008870 [Coniosporium apollinis]|uniref:Uncharacterized protein n=1 Tax=Coniosporium apollinis TaxID=61459 RepID=A0ABQ9NHK1_9PEZI|nr:hypothetical protein H2201_008870 [Coniosporium apollinis]
MHIDQSARISIALDILNSAPKADLQHYRTKVFQTFRRLQNLSIIINRNESSPVRDDYAVSTSFTSHTSSPENDNTLHTSSLRETYPPPSKSGDDLPAGTQRAALLKALEKNREKIEEYLEQPEEEATAAKPTLDEEDYRIVDFIRGGGSSPTYQDKFRKLLGERDLAKEFKEWEFKTYEASRVDSLVQNQADKAPHGNVMEFVEEHDQFVNKEMARRCVRNGIKLLVIEALLKKYLQDLEDPITRDAVLVEEPERRDTECVEDKSSGISALLAFTSSLVRRMKYEEIADFIELLNHPRFSALLGLARRKSDWFDECQRLYTGKYRRNRSELKAHSFRGPKPKKAPNKEHQRANLLFQGIQKETLQVHQFISTD